MGRPPNCVHSACSNRPSGGAWPCSAYQTVRHQFPGVTRSPWVATATIPQRRHIQTWTIPPKSVVVEGRVVDVNYSPVRLLFLTPLLSDSSHDQHQCPIESVLELTRAHQGRRALWVNHRRWMFPV